MSAEMPLLNVSALYRRVQEPCRPTYFCYTNSTREAGASARLATAVVWTIVASSSTEYFFCESLFLSSSLPKYIICKFLLFFALTSWRNVSARKRSSELSVLTSLNDFVK